MNNKKAIKPLSNKHVCNEQKFTLPETSIEVLNSHYKNIKQKHYSNITSTYINPFSYVPINQSSFYLYSVLYHECVTGVENLKSSQSDLNNLLVYLLKLLNGV